MALHYVPRVTLRYNYISWYEMATKLSSEVTAGESVQYQHKI